MGSKSREFIPSTWVASTFLTPEVNHHYIYTPAMIQTPATNLFGRAVAAWCWPYVAAPRSQRGLSCICALLPLDAVVELVANRFDVACAVLLHVPDPPLGNGEHLPSYSLMRR